MLPGGQLGLFGSVVPTTRNAPPASDQHRLVWMCHGLCGVSHADGTSASESPNGSTDLVLTLSTGDTLTVKDWFNGTGVRLGVVRFSDGTAWYGEEIFDRLLQPTGGNDTIVGSVRDEVLRGESGDDVMFGSGGEIQTGRELARTTHDAFACFVRPARRATSDVVLTDEGRETMCFNVDVLRAFGFSADHRTFVVAQSHTLTLMVRSGAP